MDSVKQFSMSGNPRVVSFTTGAILSAIVLSGCVSNSPVATNNKSSTENSEATSSESEFKKLQQWKGRQINNEPALILTADELNAGNAEGIIRYMMKELPGDKTEYSIGTKETSTLISVIGNEEEDVQNVVSFVNILDSYGEKLNEPRLKEHGSYQNESSPTVTQVTLESLSGLKKEEYLGIAAEAQNMLAYEFSLQAYPITLYGSAPLKNSEEGINLAYEVLGLLQTDSRKAAPPTLKVRFDEQTITFPEINDLSPETRGKIDELLTSTNWKFKHEYNAYLSGRVAGEMAKR